MPALHRALLEWPILGNPPNFWTRDCLHQRILSPQGQCVGPYDRLSIASAILLPKGRTRLIPCLTRGASHTPPELGTNLVETFHHPNPLPEEAKVQGTGGNPQPTRDGPDPSTGAARPPSYACRTPTSRGSPFLKLLSKREILNRMSMAKRTYSARIRANKRQH